MASDEQMSYIKHGVMTNCLHGSRMPSKLIRVDKLWEQEEIFWQHRSRVKWFWEEYANTKFFHKTTLNRCKRNKMLKIKHNNDSWKENPWKVRSLFEQHFMNLFTILVQGSGDQCWIVFYRWSLMG